MFISENSTVKSCEISYNRFWPIKGEECRATAFKVERSNQNFVSCNNCAASMRLGVLFIKRDSDAFRFYDNKCLKILNEMCFYNFNKISRKLRGFKHQKNQLSFKYNKTVPNNSLKFFSKEIERFAKDIFKEVLNESDMDRYNEIIAKKSHKNKYPRNLNFSVDDRYFVLSVQKAVFKKLTLGTKCWIDRNDFRLSKNHFSNLSNAINDDEIEPSSLTGKNCQNAGQVKPLNFDAESFLDHLSDTDTDSELIEGYLEQSSNRNFNSGSNQEYISPTYFEMRPFIPEGFNNNIIDAEKICPNDSVNSINDNNNEKNEEFVTNVISHGFSQNTKENSSDEFTELPNELGTLVGEERDTIQNTNSLVLPIMGEFTQTDQTPSKRIENGTAKKKIFEIIEISDDEDEDNRQVGRKDRDFMRTGNNQFYLDLSQTQNFLVNEPFRKGQWKITAFKVVNLNRNFPPCFECKKEDNLGFLFMNLRKEKRFYDMDCARSLPEFAFEYYHKFHESFYKFTDVFKWNHGRKTLSKDTEKFVLKHFSDLFSESDKAEIKKKRTRWNKEILIELHKKIYPVLTCYSDPSQNLLVNADPVASATPIGPIVMYFL